MCHGSLLGRSESQPGASYFASPNMSQFSFPGFLVAGESAPQQLRVEDKETFSAERSETNPLEIIIHGRNKTIIRRRIITTRTKKQKQEKTKKKEKQTKRGTHNNKEKISRTIPM